MTLYTDIPSRSTIDALWRAAPGSAVSVYVETAPVSTGEAERIAYKGLVKEALAQLQDVDKKDLAGLEEELAVLEDEDSYEFWRHQARTLAVFASPHSLLTFRLPNRITPVAVGGSRFFVKPLLRALTFPQTAYVLALAQGSVRLLETVPDAPAREVPVPDMPQDVASAVGKSSIRDRSPIGRVQGSEGQKMRMMQFSRQVDAALREVLPGQDVPLVLAATEPLDSIFRAHCSYPDLVPDSVSGNPEGRSDVELVAAARELLDGWYAGRLEQERQTFADRAQQGRSASDASDLARFATVGAVETLYVDIDATAPGEVDEAGEVSYADAEAGPSGDVLEEVARRAWFTGARLLAVRHEDMPVDDAVIAGTLRYAPMA